MISQQIHLDFPRAKVDGINVSWPTLMRDLSRVQAVRVEADGHTYILRTDLQATAHQAFLAAGVRPPSPVTMLD